MACEYAVLCGKLYQYIQLPIDGWSFFFLFKNHVIVSVNTLIIALVHTMVNDNTFWKALLFGMCVCGTAGRLQEFYGSEGVLTYKTL